MERLTQNQDSVERIADMYVQAAKQYLEEGDSLRSRIIDYYSGRPETEQELMNVLGNKNEEEISDYIQSIKNFTEDPVRFIEQMERLYELQDVHKRRIELALQDRLATYEEYKLGAYADVLESQVKDAVLTAQRKGYLTFQSGFREGNGRDQFMDFYNKNIVIPEETLKYLRDLSIEVRVNSFDDRTTLTLHPVGDNPVRLAQWKEVWDTLVESLPTADSETVQNMKLYKEYVDFRRKQDSLRNFS
ncbi:MAG: hypothetical protein WC629_01190 [Candidatus Paceibacterota bacterium]|jgi:hypothetical protein